MDAQLDPSQLFIQQNIDPRAIQMPSGDVGQQFVAQNMGLSPQMQGGYQQPAQIPPQLQHANDVLSQYIQSKQGQKSSAGIMESILANRFAPEDQDVARSITQTAQAYGAPELFKPTSPDQAMATRYVNELTPYTSMLEAQGKLGTNMMNQSGGATGVLINRLMSENPGMSFQDALYKVQTGFRQGTALDANGNVIAAPGAAQAFGQINYGKQGGTNQSNLEYAGPTALAKTTAEEGTKASYAARIAQQTEQGKNAAENQMQSVSTGDIVGLYNKLQKDAANAPSGYLASKAAGIANVMDMPTKGSVAQATFDADLNNLYLATIRSLKGTGRVMEQELVKIGEAAPKPTDSMEVKIAKAQAHMAYYQQRMRELGFNPDIGQPQNGTASTMPDQIQLNGFAPYPSMQPAMGQPTAPTHRFNPATGQLEEIR